jgi:hypothetical protein
VTRIIAGSYNCYIYDEGGNRTRLILKKPTLDQIYLAQEMYVDYIQELRENGCPTEEEVLSWMMKNKFWNSEKEDELAKHQKNIETFKVSLYESVYKSNQKRSIRKLLNAARTSFIELLNEKNSYMFMSCTGTAVLLRTRFLLGLSLYKPNGEQLFTEESYWQSPSYLLDQVIESYQQARIEENQYRELARTEPWRPIWNCKKSEGTVFGISPVEMNEEQRNLSIWSSLYDSIYEHSECPPDEVIEDDDTLDGWMIVQRNKRKSSMEKSFTDNEKIKNASEVYLPAETQADAQKIYELNDDNARRIIKQREAALKKHGKIAEAALPDVQLDLQSQLIRMYAERGNK